MVVRVVFVKVVVIFAAAIAVLAVVIVIVLGQKWLRELSSGSSGEKGSYQQ